MVDNSTPADHIEWLAGLQAGSESAFANIYRHFWPSLYSVTYNYVRDRHTAEELVQDLFTNLWLKRRELVIHTSLAAYLFKAIRNQIYDHIDKQTVRARVHDDLRHQVSDVTYATEEVVAYQDLQTRLSEAVELLPQPAQTVFRMSRFDHRSTQDIAQHLNLSAKAIEYHLTRALKLLRLQLKEFILLLFLLIGFDL